MVREDVKIILILDASPKAERTVMLARETRYILQNMFPDKECNIRRFDSRFCRLSALYPPIANNKDHGEIRFKGDTFPVAQTEAIKKASKSSLEATGGGDEWF